jgi:hypothetical protein
MYSIFSDDSYFSNLMPFSSPLHRLVVIQISDNKQLQSHKQQSKLHSFEISLQQNYSRNSCGLHDVNMLIEVQTANSMKFSIVIVKCCH